ncbi:PH domain-containing protein OS=Streptomyces alboniger OX=132473 GN=CP975_18295 PE=4 SV=1 [Streptomyces alboniger]
MALFSGSHTIDPAGAQQEYAAVARPGQQAHAAYLLIRDTTRFTEPPSWSTSRASPARSSTHLMQHHALRGGDGGHFDLDAELKIWQGTDQKTFTKGVDIYEVQAILPQFAAASGDRPRPCGA